MASAPALSPVPQKDRIGEFLMREGLITEDQLRVATEDARQNNTRLGYSLIKTGAIPESDLTRALARQYRVPPVDLERVKIDPKLIRLFPSELAQKHHVLPIRRIGRMLTVAMADPTDASAIDSIKFITRCDIEPVIVGEATLRRHLEEFYTPKEEENDNNHLAELLEQIESSEDIEVVEDNEEEISAAALQAQVDDAPVVRLINGILTDAVQRGASDIHIEPYEKEVRVRYRIDGALMEIMKPPYKNEGSDFLTREDPLQPEHCRAADSAGRPHQAEDQTPGYRLPCVDAARDLRRKDRDAHSGPGRPGPGPGQVRHGAQGAA